MKSKLFTNMPKSTRKYLKKQNIYKNQVHHTSNVNLKIIIESHELHKEWLILNPVGFAQWRWITYCSVLNCEKWNVEQEGGGGAHLFELRTCMANISADRDFLLRSAKLVMLKEVLENQIGSNW